MFNKKSKRSKKYSKRYNKKNKKYTKRYNKKNKKYKNQYNKKNKRAGDGELAINYNLLNNNINRYDNALNALQLNGYNGASWTEAVFNELRPWSREFIRSFYNLNENIPQHNSWLINLNDSQKLRMLRTIYTNGVLDNDLLPPITPPVLSRTIARASPIFS